MRYIWYIEYIEYIGYIGYRVFRGYIWRRGCSVLIVSMNKLSSIPPIPP